MTSPGAASAAEDAFQFFREESQVVTASRRSQPAREAPNSIEVITAEDIRASGAVNIWDLLRFRAGIDVQDNTNPQSDGLAVVSIRGFSRIINKDLQVMIDGRSYYSPSRSVASFEQLPVQIQDLERIEIVRGPSAVLYGSNAAEGVINFITKKPAAPASVSAAAVMGSENYRRGEAGVQASVGKFDYRVSATRTTRDGTSLPGGGAAGDFMFSNKGNFRGRWNPAPGTNVDLYAGGSWDTLGKDLTASGQAIPGQNRYREHFESARLTQSLGEGELEVTTTRNEVNTDKARDAGELLIREFQYDEEALYRLDWLDGRMNTVAGGSYRLAAAESDQYFPGDPKQQNRVARSYVNQSVRLLEKVTAVGGVSLEHSDTSDYEPAYQAAVIFAAAPEHAFRFSYSLAPTLPALYDLHANFLETATLRRIGNPGLDSEHVRSYEAGYEGNPSEQWAVAANVYYLDHRDLNNPNVFLGKTGAVSSFTYDNSNGALARGAEAIARFCLDAGREFYANYAYERINDKLGDLQIDRGTPVHAFNLGGRAALGHGVSVSANAGYKDHYSAGTLSSGYIDVPAYWRLDGRLAYSPRRGVELFVAGQNLAQAYHGAEFVKSVGVPRTFSGGISAKF